MYWDMTDAAFAVLTEGALMRIEINITGAQGSGKSTTLRKVAELLEAEGFVVRRVDNGKIKLQAARLTRLKASPYGK